MLFGPSLPAVFFIIIQCYINYLNLKHSAYCIQSSTLGEEPLMMTLVVTVDIEMCFPHSTNNLKVLIHSFLTQVADGRTPMLLRRKPVKVKPEIWCPIETVPQRMVTSCPKPVSGSTHRYLHPLPLLLSIARSIIQTAA